MPAWDDIMSRNVNTFVGFGIFVQPRRHGSSR